MVANNFNYFQEESEPCTETDLKSDQLENGLNNAAGPAGHTPVPTMPKTAAANKQAPPTGNIPTTNVVLDSTTYRRHKKTTFFLVKNQPSRVCELFL